MEIGFIEVRNFNTTSNMRNELLQNTLSSKYFEILSHPIRYAILVFIDVGTRNYSEIMEGIDFDTEIRSNKLNFHLRKMLDEGILVKQEKSYAASEQGLKLLSLMYQFEKVGLTESKPDENDYATTDITKNEKDNEEIKNEKEFIIQKLDGLPPLVYVFEYFEGKNYEYMEESHFLSLPDPISLEIKPRTWIKKYTDLLSPLVNDNLANVWLIDRFLKLGYGTRGLQDFGLMDASISVPPLESLFTTIIELLTTRGKIGLYAKTGMGKSRIALYTSSYWLRTYQVPVYYIQHPYYLQEGDFDKLQKLLLTDIHSDRKSSKYLVIIEDAHLIDEKRLIELKKFISGASNKTYAVFITFTEIEIVKDPNKSEQANIEKIEQLKQELIPDEYIEELDLTNHWNSLRPYFNEWIKWLAVDILFDILPNFEFSKEKLEEYDSPWSFVASLGFLKGALKKLQSTASHNVFSLVLYYSLAQLYIMRAEKNISIQALTELISNYLTKELEDQFGTSWEETLIDLLNEWTHPNSRLLPPFRYIQNQTTLTNEIHISFYHIEWANEVCNYLDQSSENNKVIYEKFLSICLPVAYLTWKELYTKRLVDSQGFGLWLRENVRIELSENKEIILASLTLTTAQKKKMQKFTLTNDELKELKQSQLVNWLFIKSIISS